MNWLIAVNLLILVVITGVFCVGFLFFRRLYRDISDFITPSGENEPSPLSQAVDAVSCRLAKSMAVEVKTTIMGMLSGQARQEKMLDNAEQTIEAAVGNPAFSAVVDMLPKDFKKKAMKNPAIVNLVLSKLGGGGAGRPADVPVASGNGSRPKFNL